MYGRQNVNPYDPQALQPPTGRLVLTFSTRESNSQIVAINADGSCEGRLTHSGSSESDPVWSPDGTRIAFFSMRTGSWNLFTMRGDGEDVRQVTCWDELWPWGISWAPNGRHIVFSARRARDDRHALYIIGAGGSRQRTLLADPDIAATHPAWSPAGNQILFSAQPPDALTRIESIRPDGSERRVIAQHDALEYRSPAWSPDARAIVFCAAGDPKRGSSIHDLYLMDADGGNIHAVSWRPTPGGAPCWSPDGRHISFYAHSYCEDRDFQVYIMNADGTGISRPASFQYGAGPASWGPVYWVWGRGLVPQGRVIPLG